MASRNVPTKRDEQRMVDRLFSLKRTGESDAAFARRLGLQPQHLSNYRNGHHGLSLQTAVLVARATGVTLDWLLMGRGRQYFDHAGPEASAARLADRSANHGSGRH